MSNPQITFYDIASGPPIRCYAPNPWKTRYALNFKRHHANLHYTTSWTDLAQVPAVRASLGAPPVRTHAIDGGAFPTLPVIVDHAHGGAVVGDSFDIAVHLDATYPSTPALFPHPSTMALTRAFNAAVDKVFTDFVTLAVHNLPFNPDTAEVSKVEFCRRAGGVAWEDVEVREPRREEMLREFEAALGGLARLWVKREEGPFLEGSMVMYADLIVGGWLAMMKETLPEWERLRTWQDGIWGRLHDALALYAQS